MPTVIDELVVQIGLDPSKFSEGRRHLDEELGKGRQAVEAFGNRVEESGQKISEVFAVAKRGAVGILAAFVGNEAATFIERVAQMDATTGRLARSIGESSRELSIWQNVARSVGGTAEDANATFAGLNDAFMNAMMKGQMFDAGFASLMGRAGITWSDKPNDVLQKTAQWLAATNATPREQRFWLEQIPGMTVGMLSAVMELLRNPEKMHRLRDELAKLAPKQEDIERAQQLQLETSKLDTALDNLARAGFPALTMIIEALVSVLEKIPPGLLASIVGGAAGGAVVGTVVPGVGTAAGAVAGGVLGGFGYYMEHRGGGNSAGVGSRGDRDRNPGNIEAGPWATAHGATGTDGRFAIFPDEATGEAAMAALLQERYRGLTLADIQKRWVGNADNGYLGQMSKATNLRPGDVPNLNDPATLRALMRGMMWGEGTHPAAGDKQSSVTINGGIHVTSSKADPKGVADEVPEAMRRFAMMAGMDTGLV